MMNENISVSEIQAKIKLSEKVIVNEIEKIIAMANFSNLRVIVETIVSDTVSHHRIYEIAVKIDATL